jgi:uncharacterized protein involved in exopolysaccharide biosynthesis
MKAHAARKEVLEAELEKQNQELALLSSREMKLNELTRDVGLAETEYRQYRESLQRAKVSMALDLDNVSNVSVVQPATVYPSPIRPNRPLNILLGAIAGAVLAVFLAFAIEYFDDSMNTKEDIESLLGVPVLAVFTEDGTGAPGLA